jgi:AcrR family transcriptional regulator
VVVVNIEWSDAMTPGSPTSRRGGQRRERDRPYHHGDLRVALIQAGVAILAEEGTQALTLRAAARRAGVSHSAPYRHFADKEALLAAIAEEGFSTLADQVAAAAARFPGAPLAQLEEAGWAYVRFALAHPDHLRVMFGGVIPDPRVHSGLQAAGSRAFSALVSLVQAAQEAEAVVGGNPRQVAVAAWAMVHGLALLLIGNQVPADVRVALDQEQLVRLCLRLQFQGLSPRGGAA